MAGGEGDTPAARAEALWSARRSARAMEPISGLSLQEGNLIASSLYDRLGREGARQIGWKIAATDPGVQRRFETDRPFTAPVFDISVYPPGSTISLGSLIAPLIETEVGVSVAGGVVTVLPCIEIADCRIRGWSVKLPAAIADFGLQGAMLFGEPVAIPRPGTLEAAVTRDGQVVSRGMVDLPAAVARARELPMPAGAAGRAVLVATGAVFAPVPLTAGRWMVAFGPLGALSVVVTA